jgi:hypothetical protein
VTETRLLVQVIDDHARPCTREGESDAATDAVSAASNERNSIL